MPEECTAQDTGEGKLEPLSPAPYMKTSFGQFLFGKDSHGYEQGLTTLAFKLAYDIFRNPEQFKRLLDRGTGASSRPQPIHGANGTRSTGMVYYEDGRNPSYAFFYKYLNGTRVTEPFFVNESRFETVDSVNKLKLAYKRLTTLEHYSLDQLFFLNAISVRAYHPPGTT